MSYRTRMYLRLALPCLAVILAVLAIMVIVQTLTTLPALLGGVAVWPDLPGDVFFGGYAIFLIVCGVQAYRVYRWQAGKDEACWLCESMLGFERERRYTRCRRCLGCEKYHSVETLR